MASAHPNRLTRLALAALCACGAAAAQAESSARLFQVRLQLLPTCRVGAAQAAHEGEPGSPRMLAIRCSRHTPFAIDGVDMGLPPLAGTGVGMGTISASWPLRERAAALSTPPAPAGAPTLHVAY